MELVVVSALCGVVLIGIYNTLNSGLKIWGRLRQFILEEDIEIFFEKFNSDLYNSFVFTGLEMKGDKEELEFATLSPVQEKFRGVAKVYYFYDPTKKRLIREERDYAEVYNKRRGKIRHILENVNQANFLYYFYDQEKGQYIWKEEMEGFLPLAISLELEIKYKETYKKFKRIVNIPLNI